MNFTKEHNYTKEQIKSVKIINKLMDFQKELFEEENIIRKDGIYIFQLENISIGNHNIEIKVS